MHPGITELELTDASTISIPTDAILILFLLIVFALIGYLFHYILDNQTNQFFEKVDDNSHLELVKEKLDDQLTLESATVNNEKLEKPSSKKLNFIPPSKFWRIASLAVAAIGGSSLLKIQSIQHLYKEVKTSQVNIKTKNQAKKSLLSIAKIKSSTQSPTKIKKISYVDPLLSTNNSSKNNNFLRIQERKIEDFFSF